MLFVIKKHAKIIVLRVFLYNLFYICAQFVFAIIIPQTSKWQGC